MKNILVSMHPYGNAQRQFLAGVSYYAHTRNDWALHFDPSPDRLTAESFARDGETGISGAIICEAGVPDLESILVYSPVPVVVFGSPRETLAATHSPVGWSMSDDEGIGAFAAEHFTSLGTFRSYAFVADPLDSGWSRGHCRGFKTRLKHLAKDIFVFTRPAGEGNVARKRALSCWLKTLAKPAAVLAANDIVGAEVLACARAARIAVPDVMSVIGIGNDTLLDELSRPPLTSVAVDHEEEGASSLTSVSHGDFLACASGSITAKRSERQSCAFGSTRSASACLRHHFRSKRSRPRADSLTCDTSANYTARGSVKKLRRQDTSHRTNQSSSNSPPLGAPKG